MIGIKSGMRLHPAKEESLTPLVIFFAGSVVIVFSIGVFLLGTQLGGY